MTTESQTGSNRILGVDTGGTFTDFVFFDGEALRVAKLASTPAAPERAVIEGGKRLAGDADARLVHGSTVATNALLEDKTARTVYIANAGLTDVLTLGRQTRRELYALEPSPQPVPVPAELCLAVGQRTDAEGRGIAPLDDAELAALVERIESLAPDAVAINLLYSFFDDDAERRIAEAMPADVYVSRSSQVLAEQGEYERGIATWLNAGLGPVIGRYLGRLREALGKFAVMHSAAGTLAADRAATHAVQLLLSGPAAGLLGARYMGRLAGFERLVSFDMGGTSTDVALIDGEVRLTSDGQIAGYPVAVPMVELHTIGAGGGSIAGIDAGGMLRVGPRSAGADPGPACYGQGGEHPTVTDANLVLGRLPASTRLGGEMRLDADAARSAMTGLAEQLDLSVEQAAQGVIAVVNEAMAGALRVASVQRGEDPRQLALLCFGGAGGLQVCALAQALGMANAVVPVYAGVLSALGMLVARRSRELSRSLLRNLDAVSDHTVEAAIAALRERGVAELAAEGVAAGSIEAAASLDLRYAGQSFALNLPWQNVAGAAQAFHRAHEDRYGHRLEQPVELVNVRLSLRGPVPELAVPQWPAAGDDAPEAGERVAVYGVDGQVPVFDREALGTGHSIPGPAIVRETVATTWIAPGWVATIDKFGNLRLRRESNA